MKLDRCYYCQCVRWIVYNEPVQRYGKSIDLSYCLPCYRKTHLPPPIERPKPQVYRSNRGKRGLTKLDREYRNITSPKSA